MIHEKALVETDKIGKNTRVWAFTHIMKGVSVGDNCNICSHVYLESGSVVGNNVTVKNHVSIWDKVTIEDNVFVGPGVTFTNHLEPRAFIKEGRTSWKPTLIKNGTTLGAGSVILCNIVIEEFAFIAAGCVVTKSVKPHRLMVGNPAREYGYICKCSKTRIPKTQFKGTENCPHCSFDFKMIRI